MKPPVNLITCHLQYKMHFDKVCVSGVKFSTTLAIVTQISAPSPHKCVIYMFGAPQRAPREEWRKFQLRSTFQWGVIGTDRYFPPIQNVHIR